MDKNNCISLSFRDLSPEESMAIAGGTSFAYDVGRVLRFLGIAAGGMNGPSLAISDWVCTSFLEQ
jgi:hypothetical protein